MIFISPVEKMLSFKSNFILTLLFINIISGTEIIVTNHPECTKMGEHYVIQHNVTVSELAIIVSVCEGIVNPQYSGLGGGFMAVVFNGKCGESKSLNSREKAPRAYQPSSGKKYGEIGVPSMLKGYEALYEMHLCGETPALPWSELFTENIKLARNGWNNVKNTKELLTKLRNVDHTLEISSNGDQMKNPTLSRTLEKIAKEGPSSSMYKHNGELLETVTQELQSADSFITSDDILKYDTDNQPTFNQSCLDYTIATTRIPGSGTTLILGCKIISAVRTQLKQLPYEKQFLFMYHTMRYMYSVKPYLRSKRFSLSQLLNNAGVMANDILQMVYRVESWNLTPIRKFGNYQINDTRVRRRREFGTTNIILRRDKSAVTMTSTVNWYFGSRLCSKRLGFFYNNQLKDFDDVNTPNGPKPGKTPQSSTSATILYSEKNNPVFQIGAAGGSKMIGAIFNTFFNYFIAERSLEEANKLGRCTPQYLNHYETILCEKDVGQDVKNMFGSIGMSVDYTDEKLGGVTASSTVRNYPEAVFDVRRGGEVYIDRHVSTRAGTPSKSSRNNH